MAQIRHYGLLDPRDRPDLDGLAELAARICGVVRAIITYITDTQVVVMASVGFEMSPLARSQSICNAVLLDGFALIAADLLADDRFHDSYAATAGIARFYTSHQLVLPGDDEPIGSLCVFDPEPRTLDPGQVHSLEIVAARIVDVLELDLRNRELHDAVQELERSNAHLEAFAGQVSHDLRNPLGALSGSLEILADLTDEPEPDVEQLRLLVSRARRGTDRMTHLVGGQLDFAAVGGRLELAEVDADELVAAVLEDLVEELDGVRVTVGALPGVSADAVQLRVVVQNLIANASKYAHGSAIDVRAVVEDESWTLRVVDHGPGVGEADRERVLEPFVRLGSEAPGTGMGLATCRRIAHAHGGEVGLDETPGGGATAWISLPDRTAP